MHTLPLYPLQHEAESLLQHCNLPLHVGQATIGSQPETKTDDPLKEWFKRANPDAPKLTDVMFDTAFLMPLIGGCYFFLQCRCDFRLQRDFGMKLRIDGESSNGPFALQCDEISVEAEGEGPGEHRWAIARQVNKPAELTYGAGRPFAQVLAVINNFDFDVGNAPHNSGIRGILRVRAAGRTVDFSRRRGYEQIRSLLRIEALGHAPLLTFSFNTWEGASETELVDFAHDIAGLCGIAARQHTGIPVLSFLDCEGQIIKHLLGDPLKSRYREQYALAHLQLERSLPKLFDECFDSYRTC